MILDRIVAAKREELLETKRLVPFESVRLLAAKPRAGRSFAAALQKRNHLSIIGEIKKASPSKGVIRGDFEPVQLAADYISSSVDAISILTESRFFLGSAQYLSAVAAFSTVPLLRKDFIIDEYQLYEAAALGADAVLLIAAVLDDARLKEFLSLGHSLGLDLLVEVHSAGELERVLKLDARIIGVNNRNLNTFQVDIQTAVALKAMIPGDKITVAESGIATHDDFRTVYEAGIDAVLVGESFMRSQSISDAVKDLRGDVP